MEKAASQFSTGTGDSALDRRYLWAREALSEGDPEATIDILDQTLALVPGFAAGWHLYGRAQEALGRHEEAATAWRQCLEADPGDRLGARLDLARIGAIPAEEATSEEFSGMLFDGYAERFDSHLVGHLHYNGPALLVDALASACNNAGEPFRFDTVFDLGCGTGLMGEAIRAQAGFLAGCDVSARMVERARAKAAPSGAPLYDKLAVAGLTDFLASRPDSAADLVIAADVFVYVGDIAPAFAQSARVLKPGGLLAFTVQTHDGEGVIVGADRRFAHAEGWLRERLEETGLHPTTVIFASARQDRGVPVPGLVVLARKD